MHFCSFCLLFLRIPALLWAHFLPAEVHLVSLPFWGLWQLFACFWTSGGSSLGGHSWIRPRRAQIPCLVSRILDAYLLSLGTFIADKESAIVLTPFQMVCLYSFFFFSLIFCSLWCEFMPFFNSWKFSSVKCQIITPPLFFPLFSPSGTPNKCYGSCSSPHSVTLNHSFTLFICFSAVFGYIP